MKLMIVLLVAACASAAGAEPYWVAWEGNDLPENQGWERNWGNWEGQYEGPGAIRTLEDGVLTYDSLYDNGVYDFSIMSRPGAIDPEPGEMFVMEWRLKVDQVEGGAGDPTVWLFSDDAWVLGLKFGYDRIYSVFEDYLEIPINPGLFHTCRLTSRDMNEYDLFIDNEPARHGAFWESIGPSEVGWGDSVQGAASLHHWDYFRFGVVPEPSAIILISVLGACCGRRRL